MYVRHACVCMVCCEVYGACMHGLCVVPIVCMYMCMVVYCEYGMYVLWCVCYVYVCVVCVFMCCAHMYGGQRRTLGVFLNHSLFCF